MGWIVSQQPRQKKGSRRSIAGRPQAAQSMGKTQCKILSSTSGMELFLFLALSWTPERQPRDIALVRIVGTLFFVL
jgi:hypothetical protein